MKKELLDKISLVQDYLKKENLDAWIIYQFIDKNEFFDAFIGRKIIASRRAFLLIPKTGKVLLVHSIVDGGLSELHIPEKTYASYEQFLEVTKYAVKGLKNIVMEYSPMSKIPHISKVDGGMIDVFKSFHLDIQSSGNLLQLVGSLTDKQVDSHIKASKLFDQVRLDAFAWIEKELKKGIEVSEYSIQQKILALTTKKGMETIFEPEININENAAKPHYLPTKEKSLPFHKGDLLLIDMWAKLKEEDSIYTDITWMVYRGEKVPEEINQAFHAVITGRDKAVTFLTEKFAQNQPVYGWEVDKIARDSITKAGYGEYFTHRLGHSLGTFVHGNLVHFDNYENIDDRQVMNNHLGTIEPGVYIPGKFGIRSEINIMVKDNKVSVTTSLQKEIYLVQT